MSLLLALLLLQPEAEIRTETVRPPFPDTVQSLTRPLYTIECDLIDSDLDRYRLVLSQTGGRGYLPRQADDRAVRPRQTPITFAVGEDTTGKFGERVVRGEWVDNDYVHRVSASIRGEIGARDPWTLRFELAPDNRYAVRVSSREESYQQYVGFCSMEKRAQQPLSSEEVNELPQ
jgi:hypothetical protein